MLRLLAHNAATCVPAPPMSNESRLERSVHSVEDSTFVVRPRDASLVPRSSMKHFWMARGECGGDHSRGCTDPFPSKPGEVGGCVARYHPSDRVSIEDLIPSDISAFLNVKVVNSLPIEAGSGSAAASRATPRRGRT